MNWKKLARWSGMMVVFVIMGTVDIISISKIASLATDTSGIINAAKELGAKWVIIAMVIVTFYYKLESEKDV